MGIIVPCDGVVVDLLIEGIGSVPHVSPGDSIWVPRDLHVHVCNSYGNVWDFLSSSDGLRTLVRVYVLQLCSQFYYDHFPHLSNKLSNSCFLEEKQERTTHCLMGVWITKSCCLEIIEC